MVEVYEAHRPQRSLYRCTPYSASLVLIITRAPPEWFHLRQSMRRVASIQYTSVCCALLSSHSEYAVPSLQPDSLLTLPVPLCGTHVPHTASPWALVYSLYTSQAEACCRYRPKDLLHRLTPQEVWSNRTIVTKRGCCCRPRCFQGDSQDRHQIHEERVVPEAG